VTAVEIGEFLGISGNDDFVLKFRRP